MPYTQRCPRTAWHAGPAEMLSHSPYAPHTCRKCRIASPTPHLASLTGHPGTCIRTIPIPTGTHVSPAQAPTQTEAPSRQTKHAHSRSRPGTQTSMQTCCSCPGDRQASLTPASGAPCFPQKRVDEQGHETGTNVKPQTCCPSSWPPASGKLVDQPTPDSSLPDVVIGTGMCRCAVVQLPGPSRPPPCSSEGRSQGVGEAYLPGQVHAGPVPLMQGMWPCTGQPGS